ncbi:hypothetical protein, partial [Solemya velum gill symbiont]
MTIRQGLYLIALLAFLCLQTAFAQEKEGEVVLTAPQRAEKMIILNENGVVGVTYSYPWSFKWAEYASSLGELFVKEIYSAQNECENTLAKLKANEDALLGSSDPPPISWSTLMMRKTEDQKWESSDTNRKRSSR